MKNIKVCAPVLVALLVWGVGLSPAVAGPGEPGHSHGEHSHAAPGADVGEPGKASEVNRVVRIEARDVAFNVKQIQIKPGETIKFVITNKGQTRHEFSIGTKEEEAEHRAMMQQMPDMVHNEPSAVTLEPGETKELIWKFGKAKDLEFSCNIPGHAEQGMKGVFRTI